MLQRLNEMSSKDCYFADLNGANRPEPDGQSWGNTFKFSDLLTSQSVDPATPGSDMIVHTFKDLVTLCCFTPIPDIQARMRCQYLSGLKKKISLLNYGPSIWRMGQTIVLNMQQSL